MAVDTRDKRSSAINVGSPWRGLLPAPDAAPETQADRQHAALMYSGILAGGVIPPTPAVEAFSGGWPVRYKKWPLPPPTFPTPVEAAPEIMAFGTTPETELVPHWIKTGIKKRGGLYIPRMVRLIERPAPMPRKARRRKMAPEAEPGVSADEVIRKWRRQEEENLVMMLISTGEL